MNETTDLLLALALLTCWAIPMGAGYLFGAIKNRLKNR